MSLLSARVLTYLENIPRILHKNCVFNRQCSSSKQLQSSKSDHSSSLVPDYLYFHDNFDLTLKSLVIKDMAVVENFLSGEEENSILKEIEPYLKRLRYEFDHWDDVSFLLS